MSSPDAINTFFRPSSSPGNAGGAQLPPDVQAAVGNLKEPKDRAMLRLAHQIETTAVQGQDFGMDAMALKRFVGNSKEAEAVFSDPQAAFEYAQILKQNLMNKAGVGLAPTADPASYPVQTQTAAAPQTASTAYTDQFMADPSANLFDLDPNKLMAEATAGQQPGGSAPAAAAPATDFTRQYVPA